MPYMPRCATQVCLYLSQFIVCINDSNITVALVFLNETLDTALVLISSTLEG